MSLSFTYYKCGYIENYKRISLSIKQGKERHDVDPHIKNGGTAWCICPKALLTVEAAVVLPFFVCFMVFILYFFRILQVQAGVAQALQYAGRRTAAEYSILEGNAASSGKDAGLGDFGSGKDAGLGDFGSGKDAGLGDFGSGKDAGLSDFGSGKDAGFGGEKNNDIGNLEQDTNKGGGNGVNLVGLAEARLFFQKQLKKQACPIQYIKNGMAGISLMQSGFSDNYVELKAVYRMKLPVGLLGDIQYRIVQEAKCRKWTGYQLGQDTQEDDAWLYYTEHGTVYHASRSCTYLDLSIRGVTYAQAGNSRNKSGGKYHKCDKCGSQPSNSMVYITDYGDRYHNSLTCSGLKRSIYMIRKSKAAEKRMCSKCGG